jgi:hypothetical protein
MSWHHDLRTASLPIRRIGPIVILNGAVTLAGHTGDCPADHPTSVAIRQQSDGLHREQVQEPDGYEPYEPVREQADAVDCPVLLGNPKVLRKELSEWSPPHDCALRPSSRKSPQTCPAPPSARYSRQQCDPSACALATLVHVAITKSFGGSAGGRHTSPRSTDWSASVRVSPRPAFSWIARLMPGGTVGLKHS